MVNKSLLTLALVAVFIVFGVGAFVGAQVAGDGDIATTTDDDPSESATPTAAPAPDTTTSTPESTPTPEPTPEPTATPEPEDIPAEQFNATNISIYIGRYLDEDRTERGLDEFTYTGRTAETVQAMAQNHTDVMANNSELAHEIDGVRSEDRYEAYGLTSVCTFDSTETPSDNELEAIGRTIAGQPYTEDGQQRFNADDSDVARALVDYWFSTEPYTERITQPNAERTGIGVNVTSSGEVYATVNLCS